MKKYYKILALVLTLSFVFGVAAYAETSGGSISAGAPLGGVLGGAEGVGKSDESAQSGTESTQAGASFGTLINENPDEYPAVLALEARIAGHSGLYKDIAITTVENYVNIRTEASADSEVVGKIHNNCGAYIDGTVENEEGTWYLIHSGSCKGYVLAEFFLTGKDAQDIASTVSTMTAKVNTDALRLRATPSLDGDTVTTLSMDEEYLVTADKGEFLQLKIDDDLSGYVLDEYVDVSITFKQAISIEEEKAEIARKEEQERQRREAAEAAAREAAARNSGGSSSSGTPGSNAGSISRSRQSLVDYACSFVGSLRYVYGGNSLTYGTDCSGFVHMMFAAAGISVGRTDVALRSAGKQISSSQMRPGDIVCYYGHVAIYIGNGQVVHCSSAYSTPNTKISTWNYRSVCCIVNPWGD